MEERTPGRVGRRLAHRPRTTSDRGPGQPRGRAARWGLMPRPEAEAKSLLQWAEKAAAADRPAAEKAWSQFVLGLAHLRAGQTQAAIDAAERSLKDDRTPGGILNYPVLAMAHHK